MQDGPAWRLLAILTWLRTRILRPAVGDGRGSRRRWRRLTGWTLVLVVLGLGAGAAALTVSTYTALELSRFARGEARRVTYVYAAGQRLAPGINVRAVDLAGTLARLRYTETRAPTAPGQFARQAGAWEIALRGDDPSGASRLRLETRGDRITRVLRDGQPVESATLAPEVLTTALDRRGEEYRPIRLADAPLVLLNAVLAVEDHRFFEHRGVDLHGLLRAAWTNIRTGRVTQGGSTLTQQLVKNRLLSARRTYTRKLTEAWLAAVLEWRYSKEQILEAYLNEIYLGQRGSLAIRGMGAAARAYFRKEIHQLTLPEAALLAGITRAPNAYSPTSNPTRAKERRDLVLARMHELGMINAADLEAAQAEPLRVQQERAPGQPAPYFADYARQQVDEFVGEDAIGGRIFTTLDLGLQRFAEAAVARGLDRLEARWPKLRRNPPAAGLQAALVALDPRTGEIRALVGGRDYQASQFNRAVSARRQPGSAFKPIVYLAALAPRAGGGPAFTAATLVDDAPLVVPARGRDAEWIPRNYEDRFEGRVTVRRALEASLNSATVRIALEVGLPAVVDTARRLGIESPLAPVPALALGAFEVTPLELARVFATLAAGGVRPPPPTALHTIRGSAGGDLPFTLEPGERVASTAAAYLLTSLLEGVVTRGTGVAVRAAGVTAPVAGKTGTTNDGRDAWFVGYTPTLVVVVWVGYDSNEPHGLSGSDAAVPIWADFMKQALAAYPSPAFTVPAGLSFADIDPTTGRLATRFCPVTAPELFLGGTEPGPCPEHSAFGGELGDWWRRFRDWIRRR
jgi:penicillin-binding protein 1B